VDPRAEELGGGLVTRKYKKARRLRAWPFV
jgi:hypothetical protein